MSHRDEVYKWAQREMFRVLEKVWDHRIDPHLAMAELTRIGDTVNREMNPQRSRGREYRGEELFDVRRQTKEAEEALWRREQDRVREAEHRQFMGTMAKMPSIVRDVAPGLLGKK